jgi:3-deoxy-D-manno-octulosonic-acid transferase
MTNAQNPNVPNGLVNGRISRQSARNFENASSEFEFGDLNLFRISYFVLRI